MNNTMFFYVALLFLSSIAMAGEGKHSIDRSHDLNLYDKFEIDITYPEASLLVNGIIMYLRHTADFKPIQNKEYNKYKIVNQHVMGNVVFEENKDDGSMAFKSTEPNFSMRFDRNNRKILEQRMYWLLDIMAEDAGLTEKTYELHFIDPKCKHSPEGTTVQDWYTLQLSAKELNHFQRLKDDKIKELTEKRNEELRKKKIAESNMQELEIKQRMKYENRLTIATRVIYFLGFICCYLVYLKFR